MEELRHALLLSVIVMCIMAATRPATNRRRRTRPALRRPSRRTSKSPAAGSRRLVDRNRWDRLDLARGIGRDHIDPDGTVSLWPAP